MWIQKNGCERVPQFINLKKENTATAKKLALSRVFDKKTGKKRPKKELYDEFFEVKVVYWTLRKDYILFQFF